MRLQLNTKILLGFTIALVVLMLTSLLAYRSIQQLGFYTRGVEHTYQVMQQTSDLRMQMRDAQMAARNYLLLADSARLAEVPRSLQAAFSNYDTLQTLTRDNPLQQARLDTLRQLMAKERVLLQKFSTVLPTPYAARDLVLADQMTLLSLRRLLNTMTVTETMLLNQRRQNQDFYENTSPLAIIVSAVLVVLIVLWLFSKIWRELKANQRLQTELTTINEETARRIEIIENLANQVVQGDYSVKISSNQQRDSLGKLSALLNRMTQTLDENFTALKNRNQELDQFAYVASHDLKAPLRGVMTVVKWIEDELPGELSEQMRQYLSMMKGRLSRLENLINGLLAYARAGRTEKQLEQVDVAALVRETVDLVVPEAFRVELAGQLPVFETDRLSLQQVFTNLLSNAAKYHDQPTGTIRVSCRDVGKCYEFQVQDDGPGIAPEYHEKIFLIFQTLRDRHTAESTGIGLSIVRKILDELKGSISVESAVGRGSTFTFTWPKTIQTA